MAKLRTDIQGLRAVAVLLVVVYHAGLPAFGGGYVGVDVFFVISGFLITTHLVTSIDAKSFSFTGFYARRARRLLPAALTTLILSVVCSMIWLPPLAWPQMLRDAAATAMYVPNVLFGYVGTDYLADHTPSVFQHYWSLGLEEQFYLLWPPFLLGATLLARKSYRRLLWFIIALTAASFLLGWWMTLRNQPWAFFLLPTRAWELGVGGIVAVLLIAWPRLSEPTWWKPIVTWSGLAGIGVAALLFTEETPFPSFNAALPVVATALVVFGGSGRSAADCVLSLPFVQFFGKISYSLYLVHWPLVVIPQAAIGAQHPLPLAAKIGLSAIGVPLAWALWRYVEEPGRQGTWIWTTSARRVLVAAVASGVTIAAVAVLAMRVVTSFPLHTDRDAPETVITAFPEGTTFVPANLAVDLWSARSDNAVIYSNGCHQERASIDSAGCQLGDPKKPHVALFGDSHAANWFPAFERLANDGLIYLDSNTKSSCASAAVEDPFYASCEVWRQKVIARLVQDPPDIVVLANSVETNLQLEPDWSSALSETARALNGSSRVVVFADVQRWKFDPPTCLSQRLDNALDCSSPPSAASLAATQLDRDGADRAGATFVDLRDYFCASQCPAIIGNTVVMRDNSHFTATYSALLAPLVRDAVGLGQGRPAKTL